MGIGVEGLGLGLRLGLGLILKRLGLEEGLQKLAACGWEWASGLGLGFRSWFLVRVRIRGGVRLMAEV